MLGFAALSANLHIHNSETKTAKRAYSNKSVIPAQAGIYRELYTAQCWASLRSAPTYIYTIVKLKPRTELTQTNLSFPRRRESIVSYTQEVWLQSNCEPRLIEQRGDRFFINVVNVVKRERVLHLLHLLLLLAMVIFYR
jgi:hypothetical protein